MIPVAILASANMMPGHPSEREDAFERDEQMGKLVPAFADQGLALELIEWRGASEKAAEYAAMLPLFVWDYFEGNEADFRAEMARIDMQTLLLNPFKTIKWNTNKTYLDELEHAGARVIQTVTLDRVTRAGVEKTFERFGTDMVVIKPQIGGGAYRQVLYKQGDPFPDKESLPNAEALVQPFLPSVQTEGEYSFLYFGGQFSHAVLKQPKSGDYRIQSLYGGTEIAHTPTATERKTARSILSALDFTPLYARVDLLRGLDGGLKLIELEMVEPYLYLPHSPGDGGENKGAQMLASALKKMLA